MIFYTKLLIPKLTNVILSHDTTVVICYSLTKPYLSYIEHGQKRPEYGHSGRKSTIICLYCWHPNWHPNST